MKIVQVLNHFLPDHIAGTEVYAYELGRKLIERGHQIICVIPNYGKNKFETYDIDDMKVIRYPEPSKVDKSLQMGKRKPDGLHNFIQVLKNEKPDIVHFHELAGSNGITLHHVAAAKDLGFKVVMTFHLARYTATSDTTYSPVDVFNNKLGSYNFYRKKGFGDFTSKMLFPIASLFRKLNIDVSGFGKPGTALSVPALIEKKKKDFYYLLRNCDGVVTIAKWYRDLLIQNGIAPDKLLFIEQGINYNNSSRLSKKTFSNRIKIIFVGRISHFKGVMTLIEAVGEFDADKIQLDIYGNSGENEQYIRDCKRIASTTKHIKLMGGLRPEEIIPTMAQYDLLVLPSTLSEMSPLVIREAFAAGIPVLASNSLGSIEQIKDGENGWLFEMNNKEDLVKKLKMVIDSPELLIEASKHLPEIRTFKEVAVEYEKVYSEILG